MDSSSQLSHASKFEVLEVYRLVFIDNWEKVSVP